MLSLRLATFRTCLPWAVLAFSLALSPPPAHAQHRIAVQTLPSFALGDGEIVQVSALFLGDHSGVLEECAQLDSGDVCIVLEAISYDTSASSWTRPVRVAAIIATNTEKVDCRLRTGADLCFVRVRASSGASESAPFPLSFDPSKPLAKPASWEIRDAKSLALTPTGHPARDGEAVRIAASNYPLRTSLAAVVCTVGEAMPRCTHAASGSTGDTGSLWLNALLFAEFGTQPEVGINYTREWVDCHVANCQLELRAYGAKAPPTLTFPLKFEAAPPIARPTLEVTPSEDLISGQTVKVRGLGFTPNSEVRIMETMPNKWEDRDRATVTSSADGSFEAQVVILSDLWVDRGDVSSPELDCDVQGTCYVLAQETGGRHNFASVPLTFLE